MGHREPVDLLRILCIYDSNLQPLIENTIKHAVAQRIEGGRIDVQARTEDDHALVRVRDTGRGIPDKDISRLFEEFSQLHLHEEGAPKGSGLGLAISRHLVALHGGEFYVESEPGQGSTFGFTLPLAEEQGSRRPTFPAPANTPALRQ